MTPWTAACQASLSFTIFWSFSKSCPLSQWCHSTTSSSVVPFSSCLQSFSTSGSFPMSQLFTSGGQSVGTSALASVLPMNIEGWFSLRLTCLISLLSKRLSRVFFSTTIWKHEFFSAQPSLWSYSHICLYWITVDQIKSLLNLLKKLFYIHTKKSQWTGRRDALVI